MDKAFGKALSPALRQRFPQNDLEVMVAAHGDRSDFNEVLPSMTMPSFFYIGERDEAYADVRRAAKCVPAAQFLSLHGIGHVTALWRTGLVVPRIREFLSGVATG